MKRVLEPDLDTLKDWASGSGLPVEDVQRLVTFIGTRKHAIGPVADDLADDPDTGGVRIKYEILNWFGPNIKEKEHMPRHVIAFLNCVNPTINFTVQKHQTQEQAWDELGWSEKESAYVSDDDNWEKQTIKTGRWHDTVFESEHGRDAYHYFYQHRDDDDQFAVEEETMNIWNEKKKKKRKKKKKK